MQAPEKLLFTIKGRALGPRHIRALRDVAAWELCSRDFTEFLRYVRIPDEHRGVIDYEMWPHLVDRARSWQTGQSEVVLKARQLGISWLLAAYALWRAMFSRSTILEISQGQLEADELLDKSFRIYELLPEWLQLPLKRHNTSNPARMEFVNGSVILALPSTKKAGRSFTASLVIVDEAAFHPWAVENYRAYKPTLDGGGQLLMVSTANGTSGLFHDTFISALEGTSGSIKASFIPWWSRPSRQEPQRDAEGNAVLDHEGRPAMAPSVRWLEREKADFKGLPAEFRAEYPSSWGEAFQAQTGLVYGMDDDGILIFSSENHPTGNLSPAPCPWEACTWHYAGVDWGGGDPTAIGIYGVTSSGRVHKYTEFHGLGPVPVSTISHFLEEWAPQDGYDQVLCGAEAPNAIAELVAMGFPARTATTSRREGLGNAARFLKARRLTIDEENCPYSISEFYSYRWAFRRDASTTELYDTATPFDHHGDHCDEMRYTLMEIDADEMSRREDGELAAYRATWA